ncbi:MAG: DUF2249 domain-containing protein [Pseudoclavibacter sp.]
MRIAPHDPLPLLAQIRQLGDVGVDDVQSGPDQWRIRLTRR